jgi:hypothetical protein
LLFAAGSASRNRAVGHRSGCGFVMATSFDLKIIDLKIIDLKIIGLRS